MLMRCAERSRSIKTAQDETLERAYTLVEDHGMTINRSRTVIEPAVGEPVEPSKYGCGQVIRKR